MRGHLWLIGSIVMLCITMSYAQLDVQIKNKPTDTVLKIDKDIPMATDPRFNKMLPDLELSVENAHNDTVKPDKNIPMADDPRFNKMLPAANNPITIAAEVLEDYEQDMIDNKTIKESSAVKKPMQTVGKDKKDAHSEFGNKDDNADDYYYDYNYDDDDDEDVDEAENVTQHQIKGVTITNPPKPTKLTTAIKEPKTNHIDIDSYEDVDDINDDEEDILFNENIPCPQDCKCSRNMNSYMVANCSRLDALHQNFGADITDLEVVNVSPKYPIVLGAGFFKTIGLKRVSSIKIVNSHIEYIHPNAFDGLTELYSVNLTNSGIDMIHPNTFADNPKLRLLSLAGNDLHAMQQPKSPFTDYMLKSASLEELDLSNCKLSRMLPTAFNQLRNIVYINLADNQLRTLPEQIFTGVETIEELDLSSNSIETLPRHIFNNTALSILNMKYNEITTKLDFITHDMQKLDLSYNKMTYVNNVMFMKTTGLTSLVLKGNSIRKIHEAAFISLTELRHIDLSFNDLEQISSLIFLNNRELDVIRMNDNSRLKKLPLEGFENHYGGFNVYYFDVSNCDLDELGDKTFSTMPHLATLNLSWNNIENIGKGLFVYLTKLIELDLSNNLITDDINDLVFLHNKNLKKLSLAGNPLQTLSSHLFLPTTELIELDLSDCDLTKLWSETTKPSAIHSVLKNLRILNISNNDINNITQSDLESMNELSYLDMTNNKLHCDDNFNSLMKWLAKKKVKAGNFHNALYDHAEMIDSPMMLDETRTENTWEDFSRAICRKDAENFKDNHMKGPNTSTPSDIEDDDNIDDDDDDDDDDDEETEEILDTIINENAKNNEKTIPLINHEDIYRDTDGNYDEYSDENGDTFDKDEFVTKMNNKHMINLDDEDEIILERRPFIYYGQYRYLLPILIIVFSVMAILLLIGKIVSLLMRRRGERYRQALLASKNSIVYQKLSEDIGPVTPKFNRYAPINQV